MPLYEYECDANGHRFEVIQKFSDPLVEKCPTCGSPVHKLIASPAIQFKGSGWYITDYARKGSTEGGKTSSTKETSSEAAGKSEKSDAGTSSSSAPPSGSTKKE
jgi:putative FmdB family regulatory protein